MRTAARATRVRARNPCTCGNNHAYTSMRTNKTRGTATNDRVHSMMAHPHRLVIVVAIGISLLIVWTGRGTQDYRQSLDTEEALRDCASRAATILKSNTPIFVQRNFLSAAEVDVVRLESRALESKQAEIKYSGRGEVARRNIKVRKAEVVDLNAAGDEASQSTALGATIKRLQLTMHILAEALSLSADTEMTLLRYPVGGYYLRHRDRPNASKAMVIAARRALSFVLFLTPSGWVASSDGGQLAIWNETNVLTDAAALVEVVPAPGTLVIFESALVHEARLTQRERHAIVGWMYKTQD